MGYINEDGSPDKYGGYITKCDRCGKIEQTQDETLLIQNHWYGLFYRLPKRYLEIIDAFCLECTQAVTPLIYRLRDIDELDLSLNKLTRAINERRKQQRPNHGPA